MLSGCWLIALPWNTSTEDNLDLTHARQVLDFWKAESARPTPLLFQVAGLLTLLLLIVFLMRPVVRIAA